MTTAKVYLYDQDGVLFACSPRGQISSIGGVREAKKTATKENASFMTYNNGRSESETQYFTIAGPMGRWYQINRSTFLEEMGVMPKAS